MVHSLDGLRQLVLYGGAPFAEDVGGITTIHDDPRKAIHMESMYEEYLRFLRRSRVSKPFHTYYIEDGVRRFAHYRNVSISSSMPSTYNVCNRSGGASVFGSFINVILASSGSGKTHFINTLSQGAKRTIKDNEHPLGIVQLTFYCFGPKYLSDGKGWVSPFGAWLRPGEMPIDSLRRQALNEFVGYEVPDLHFTLSGFGSKSVYSASINVSELPRTQPGYKWVVPSPGNNTLSLYSGDDCIVDADTLLRWPEEPGWWLDEDLSRKVNFGLWQQLSSYPGPVLLYNGDVSAIPKEIAFMFNFIGVVELPWSQHKANLENRAKSGSRQPSDFRLIKANRAQLRSFAEKNSIPIFHGFNAALSHILLGVDRRLSNMIRDGQRVVSIHPFLLSRLTHKGHYSFLDVPTSLTTFGGSMSFRIHTNEYARFAGMTQPRWKHLTRNLPMYYVMSIMGVACGVKYTECGNIESLSFHGNELQPSGHILGALIWTAFPSDRVCGMPRFYPDMHTNIAMYLRNQREATPSLEQTGTSVAYHRWAETLAGVIGSYFAIKILMRKGLRMRKRNYNMWRLYCRKIIHSIVISDRTWYFDVKFNRDDDKRFGPVVS